VVGTRWLTEDEYVRLYRWLECPDSPVHPPYTRAVRILMLTGQRVEEIAKLHVDQWGAMERIIDWSKTKDGKPQAIPVPAVAAELIESITPNEYGWFLAGRRRQARHGARDIDQRGPRIRADPSKGLEDISLTGDLIRGV
jgi:integrase